MCCKRLTQPTSIQEKSSSWYHSMNVSTTLYKKNECLNSRLLCYLCSSYYKPYSRYCHLIIVLLIWQLMGTVRWYKIQYLFHFCDCFLVFGTIILFTNDKNHCIQYYILSMITPQPSQPNNYSLTICGKTYSTTTFIIYCTGDEGY